MLNIFFLKSEVLRNTAAAITLTMEGSFFMMRDALLRILIASKTKSRTCNDVVENLDIML